MTKQRLELLNEQDAKRPSLDINAISEQLSILGYPAKSLRNFSVCGESTQNYIIASCGCGTYPIELKFVCNNKFCPSCSKRRQIRLRKRLLPYLKSFKNNSLFKWRFLTLSPKNYESYEEGQKDIRESWKKFLRRSYIKDRIKGGFMVVEVTKKNQTWNFHIHAIIYSRYLDNTLRGYCPHCYQNYLKYNRNEKKFYCGNGKCNKFYNGIIRESTLSQEFSKASGRECMSDISQARSPKVVLNYMLKYITMNKDSFTEIDDFAFHVFKSYKARQINSFGKFYNFKKQIEQDHKLHVLKKCFCCGEIIKFSFDHEASLLYKNSLEKPPPSLNLVYWFEN